MTMNFFLTPNPFSAAHSGRAGLGTSDSFFITPAYIVLLSLFLPLIVQRKIILDYKMIIAVFLLILSGIYTEAILSNSKTYVYNILSFLTVGSLAVVSFINRGIGEFNVLKLAKTLTFILVFGILLAVIFPLRYGYLPFEFSRVTRGEITFWNITGVLILYPTVAILAYKKHKVKIFIVISLLMTLIILSTATRAHVVMSLLPFIIVLFLNAKPVYKLLVTIFTLPVLPLFHRPIIAFFSGQNANYSYDITNGRFELWSYHFEAFLASPLFGNGAFFKERAGNYFGLAQSEIGPLLWLSENGILFGSVMVIFLIKAIHIALRLLKKGKGITDTEFFFSVVFLSMLPNIVQTFGRVLNVEDLIFWFSVFYLNCYKKPFFPYVDFFRKYKKTRSLNA